MEYDKILLMDADLLVPCPPKFSDIVSYVHERWPVTGFNRLSRHLQVCSNVDELFDLEAPAAMGRGPWSGYAHGERINGAWDVNFCFGIRVVG